MPYTPEHNNRIELWFAAAILVALISIAIHVQPVNGQPPAPSYPAPQMQQAPAYAVPARGPLPWIRWHVFGRPTFDLYVPVGTPFPATVQPVRAYP